MITMTMMIIIIIICWQDWQWQCGAAGLLLAWLNLILYLKRISVVGVYILMFVGEFGKLRVYSDLSKHLATLILSCKMLSQL